MSEHRLTLDRETENKLRWTIDVLGVKFKLYVPKTVVPESVPSAIRVSVEHGPAVRDPGYQERSAIGLRAVVKLFAEHTETVQYRPAGESKEWIIGEPYIPKTILPNPWPDWLGLVVRWG